MNDLLFSVTVGDSITDIAKVMTFSKRSDAELVHDYFVATSMFEHVAIEELSVDPNIDVIRNGLSAYRIVMAKDGSVVSVKHTPLQLFEKPSSRIFVREEVPEGQFEFIGHFLDRAHAELAAKDAVRESVNRTPHLWPATPDKPECEDLEGLGAW